MIPITRVEIGTEEEELVLQVLRSGQLAQGPMVETLESQFAALVGTEHAVAVSSGTTALVVAIEALGLGPGDEVITSPFTFVATLNAILEAGASARFVDIEPTTFLVQAGAVADAVTDRTAALLPVHLYGQPADVVALAKTAEAHGLALIEDAAQAHGAQMQGQTVGSFGIGCFSFYATKNMATGEGGMVTTDDAAIADRIRLLRSQGMRNRYEYEVAGHNYRMTDLQAAVGIPQLARLADATSRRRENAHRLNNDLQDVPGLVVPHQEPGRVHVYHQYTVRVTADAPLSRDAFVAALAERGVGSGVYYPRPVYDYDCYRAHPLVHVEPMSEAERAGREVVSLPVHAALSDDELSRIVEVVREVLHA